MTKILDCTLRDGGYYTNWDFSKEIVSSYIKAANVLPIDYLEIGYRSKTLSGYYGEYFYCPDYIIHEIREMTTKKIGIMLNEKDVRKDDADELLGSLKGIVDLVRIAVTPGNFVRCLDLAKNLKKLGFEVGINVMYMSKWEEEKDFLEKLIEAQEFVDYFYMVDSYGGVYPEDVAKVYDLVASKCNIDLGFHGHNNLEMALINTLTAIEKGVKIVDATMTGMGRGAGNLKTELLLTALNSKKGLSVDFNKLSEVTDAFTVLHKEYEWGTNLPYMVSGANSLPQKNVMEWVSKKYYSFNSIIRALNNQKDNKIDNENFPPFNVQKKFTKALIIGGGPTAVKHQIAISNFLEHDEDLCVIFAGSRNAKLYAQTEKDKFFCLVGNEGLRLSEAFEKMGNFEGSCILPPFPRKMGTFVPEKIRQKCFELKDISFTSAVNDSCTVLALQTALELGVRNIYFAGYDGYDVSNIRSKDQELFIENEGLFENILAKGVSLESITATKYKNLTQGSIFAYLTS